ncbi:hypothetical protein D1631_13730 [Chryseobacterium nematophagum]|uniref:Uncharacterized protein n=1 Tax=Chryseobacterium nematophagum TaxID=2305228 RepID=A0A3M7TJ19_9FLAO|nr:hypothetical protein D1631_13730 [Chryseobacterium nematophagum]
MYFFTINLLFLKFYFKLNILEEVNGVSKYNLINIILIHYLCIENLKSLNINRTQYGVHRRQFYE